MLKKRDIVATLACALALGAWSGSTLATPVNAGGAGVWVDLSSPLDMNIDTRATSPEVVPDLGVVNFHVDHTASISARGPSAGGMGSLWISVAGEATPYTGFAPRAADLPSTSTGAVGTLLDSSPRLQPEQSVSVPEPGPAGLLGIGLAIMGLFLRRRRKEAERS